MYGRIISNSGVRFGFQFASNATSIMATRQRVVLDSLPLKRILALEENGTELFTPETPQEEKPLALLQRIDFDQTEVKDSKKAKPSKETSAQPAWPWQGLVESLQEAQQELSIGLDFIAHVEANEAVTVASTTKPKPLPQEQCSDFAARVSGKLQHFRDVAKYLKRTSKAMERQIEREAIFYGALMRLQRNWKVKRQRNISSGPVGNAGFTMDLSYPPSLDVNFPYSSRTTSISTVGVDQGPSGLLYVRPPPGRPIYVLQVYAGGLGKHVVFQHDSLAQAGNTAYTEGTTSVDQEDQSSSKEAVGDGVDRGAKAANAVLRSLQAAVFAEQIFDCLSREALLPSPAMNLVTISDRCIQVSLGHSSMVSFKLVKLASPSSGDAENNKVNELQEAKETESLVDEETGNLNGELVGNKISRGNGTSRFERVLTLRIILEQGFYWTYFGNTSPQSVLAKASTAPVKQRDAILGKDTGATENTELLKHFSLIVRHRNMCSKIFAMLEKQVQGIPCLSVHFCPTFLPCVSEWDFSFDIPQIILRGGNIKFSDWNVIIQERLPRFECRIVVQQETISIEGLGELVALERSLFSNVEQSVQMTRYNCSISELSAFLLCQVAGKLVAWLFEEATLMGLKVDRDMFSICFDMEVNGRVSLVACPDPAIQCINWWMRRHNEGTNAKLSSGEDGVQDQRFLGPLSLEVLRKVLVDLSDLLPDSE